MLAIVRAGGKKGGRPAGCPPGYTRQKIAWHRKRAENYAEKVLKAMEEEGIIEPVVTEAQIDNENGLAREALKELVIMLRMPGNARDKVAIASKILEYTKSKPAAKSDVKIDAAEDFLGALLAKEQE